MVAKSLIKNEIPIDIVIPWVNGNDSKHKKKINSYLNDKDIARIPGAYSTRFASVNEIKYCILSILKFASFVRNIFIVTDSQNPNVDNYIKNSFPDRLNSIRIVDHKEIFEGFEQFLPTFNSITISNMMWRIKGLSDNFICFNDDLFIIRKIQPNDFFIKAEPVLRGRWNLAPYERIIWDKIRSSFLFNSRYIKIPSFQIGQWNSASILKYKYMYFKASHTPHAINKTILKKFFSSNNNVLENNLSYKFRNYEQFTTVSLANHIEILNGNKNIKKPDAVYIKPVNRQKNYVSKKITLCAKNKNIKFVCIQSLDLAKREDQEKIFNWMDDILNL